jgi:3-oxoadipate enol-lactonase
MKLTRPDGAEIGWYDEGSGEPVLLIMGLAYPAASWFRQTEVLSQDYRVLTIDNRGAGLSKDAPGAPYTVELMADDCLAVLDQAGVERAHVVGISMGGLMAQELAISHAERVGSLCLMATHPGLADGVWPPEVFEFLASRAGMSAEQSRESSIPFNYAATTSRELIEQDWAVRLEGTAGPEGYAAQGGTALWAGLSRLPQVTAPTMVMYGTEDRLVDPGNGERIAGAVPGAVRAPVEGANHVLTTDQPETVNRLLLDWFRAHPLGS